MDGINTHSSKRRKIKKGDLYGEFSNKEMHLMLGR
jgi:hypothetical protein